MKIKIAGYNVDTEHVARIQKEIGEEVVTPEVISASYARISRDPRPIDQIRKDAREQVDKARRSNEQIVFDMGHSSIAEHAVYNIDILGISRLLIEEIERSRLVSYTEKSQRYITLKDDFVLPQEIIDAGLADKFKDIIQKQNALYQILYQELLPYVNEKYKGTIFDKKNVLEGLAKEDARYIVSLATEAQLGMTINSRNLESMLVRMFASQFQEGRDFAQNLHDTVKNITPSLIRYVQPTAYRKEARNEIKAHGESYFENSDSSKDVALVSYTKEADAIVLASILYTTSNSSYSSCLSAVRKMNDQKKKVLLMSIFKHMEQFDAVLREFENVEYLYELEISATCFAQLKRHRMATILTQPYNTQLGVVIPESIIEVGKDKEFKALVDETNEIYDEFYTKVKIAAEYVLTNAHKRRVLIKLNARSLYHLSRLREDAHAQWDIREVTKKMVHHAKEVTPLIMLLCCGKSDFQKNKNTLFEK
ncbi:FAD-dependent thymidylate synthase [Candidatus Omnitrophota bacterium]